MLNFREIFKINSILIENIRHDRKNYTVTKVCIVREFRPFKNKLSLVILDESEVSTRFCPRIFDQSRACLIKQFCWCRVTRPMIGQIGLHILALVKPHETHEIIEAS